MNISEELTFQHSKSLRTNVNTYKTCRVLEDWHASQGDVLSVQDWRFWLNINFLQADNKVNGTLISKCSEMMTVHNFYIFDESKLVNQT